MNDKFEELTERMMHFHNNYDVAFSYVHNLGETQAIVDRPDKDKVCRFCRKQYPEVKFKKKAHAISEMLGNKEFVLKSECDTCNSFFGQKLEDDLGKYLGLGRTLSQIFGKDGVPSYKSRDGKCRIDYTDKGIVIQATEDNESIIMHNNHIIFHAVRDSYTPIAVYKSLVKIALSLISYEQIPHFEDTIDWLKEESHIDSLYNMDNYTYLIERYVPGPNPMQLRVLGFTRKDESLLVPYYQFLLEFANYSFQIIIPCKNRDTKLVGSHEIEFVSIPGTDEIAKFFPMPGTYETVNVGFGEASIKIKNMGGKEKVKDEPLEPIYLGFMDSQRHEGEGETIDEIFEKEGITLKKRLRNDNSLSKE
ncbi:HNH endonuclease [Paenibacillus hunanensis]|uniref:HNH endonuclease 5 domain-containing protein n=1 Tax=Paenibacillus hunanensis TaxID=539262 RepID=A0ABU1J3V3_9BACL|nr:HNH endonuclease [Paenibacillus hunanensis]MDR6246193.1 hypothetical protein [Paenibacillus hunanensis]GGJ29485.1 hypothetical protein GCM10008022_42880 [Paenibacillus hunanensis]